MNRKALLLALAICAILLSGTAVFAGDAEAEKMADFKAVNWQDLGNLLPDKIEGMEADDLDGGTLNMPNPNNPAQQMSYSAVDRTYFKKTDKGKKKITLRITDTAFNQFLMAPFMMSMEYDSPDGSVKSIELEGHKAKLFTQKEKGEITEVQILLLVNERFLVGVEGNDLVTIDEAKEILKKIDLEKLAKLEKGDKAKE